MNENETFYLKRIQTDLKTIWDDTTIELRTKHQLLDNAIQQLILINDPELLVSIKEYFTEKEQLQKQIEKLQKEQHHLMDQYTQNMQETYEELQKL